MRWWRSPCNCAMAGNVPFDQFWNADLHVDRVYEGGRVGNAGDDQIQRLLPVGNQGGIRYSGSLPRSDIRLIVLYTSGGDRDWPDAFDLFTGVFTYYGDNKRPGHELHDTSRSGNALLRRVFDLTRTPVSPRYGVPPILVFSKAERGRDVVFRGLAVPGAQAVMPGDDLVAVWRTAGDLRFQNYRGIFTILDTDLLSRVWLDDVIEGNPLSKACPPAWHRWVSAGVYSPLISERIGTRSRTQQVPRDHAGRSVLAEIHRHFNLTLGNPYRFEQCAVDLWRMIGRATGEVDLTRPWRDGGRDAVGSYLSTSSRSTQRRIRPRSKVLRAQDVSWCPRHEPTDIAPSVPTVRCLRHDVVFQSAGVRRGSRRSAPHRARLRSRHRRGSRRGRDRDEQFGQSDGCPNATSRNGGAGSSRAGEQSPAGSAGRRRPVDRRKSGLMVELADSPADLQPVRRAADRPTRRANGAEGPPDPQTMRSAVGLFAGIGGFEAGFKAAGIHTSCSENSPPAMAVLRDRFAGVRSLRTSKSSATCLAGSWSPPAFHARTCRRPAR